MPKVAANLTMLFTEMPFLDRFEAASKAGFKFVEFLFPYEYSPEQIKGLLDRHGLQTVLFNLPSGNWDAGDRGIAANPDRKEEFRAGVSKAVVWAKTLGVTRLNCLAGLASADSSREEQWHTLVENVRFAADMLGEAGIQLMVEPINHFDIPGFILTTTRQAADLIAAVDRSNVFIQFDVYHVHREEGNITPTMREHFAKIGHIQVANNPGRHQPSMGELNYRYLFAEMDRLGYQGFVGCEYRPKPSTAESLDWIREYGCTMA